MLMRSEHAAWRRLLDAPWLAGLLATTFALTNTAHADPRPSGQGIVHAGAGTGGGPSTRVESQGGFGRITLPPPTRGSYGFRRDGEKVVVVRPARTTIGSLPELPRNIVDVVSDATTTVFTVRTGARVRVDQVRGSLVLNVFDPPQVDAPPGPTSAKPILEAQPLDAAGPAQLPGKPPVAGPDQEKTAAAAASARPADVAPVEPAGPRVRALPDSEGGGFLLPGTADAGLAAFLLADEVVVVLDQASDLVVPASDPLFERWTTRRTVDATVIRVPARSMAPARVRLSAQGWVVGTGMTPSAVGDIIPLPVIAPGAMQLAASRPGRVVSLDDPRSGGLFLVGTQGTPGQAVLEARDYSQYRLLQTVQGIVVLPTSKDVSLRREGDGFLLAAGTADAAGAQPGPAAVSATTPTGARLFTLPREPESLLLDRLQEQTRAVAEAPALARSELRLQVAETLLALGLGVEAQSVLDVAAASDPSLLNLPRAMGLRAAAAILAHRPDGGAPFADPRLAATADGRLWRALLAVDNGQASADTAKSLETELPVLLGSPGPLRDRLLPRVLETMALNGQAARAGEVLATQPPRPELDLARAMTSEALGQLPDALRQYDALAVRNDRQVAYKASLRAAELRMKAGTLDDRTGADALDHALAGWREAAQEVSLRIRIASLRRQAGQWQEALAVLKDGIVAFPEARARLDAELAGTMLALFTGASANALSPAQVVSLYDRNIDTVHSMQWPEAAGLRLVDRLVGLGLPARAEPVLAKLLAQAPDAVRRPVLGARLAALRLELNDGDGAIAALAGSAPQAGTVSADPATERDRQMLYARAEAARGHLDAALGMFQAIGTPEADSARADILVARKRWKEAVSALVALEAKRIPPAGPATPEQQAIVMRLAVAAALDEDAATLRRVADTYGAAMATSDTADRFRLLTSSPVRATADLPRAFDEIRVARRMTAQPAARPP